MSFEVTFFRELCKWSLLSTSLVFKVYVVLDNGIEYSYCVYV